jgi:N-ethylmaleimide reductase
MKNRVLTKGFIDPILGYLNSRVVMAPMTRSFASFDHLCTQEMESYYARRAKGGIGLIITEGIVIHPSGDGYKTVPYLFNEDHCKSWLATVESVHKYGAKIYAQLWHCGRISHQDFTGGFDVVSSTDIKALGINRQNNKPYGTPKRLKIDELNGIYEMYCNSARLAIESGFDGVEIHMGHGYLVDQFLDANINDRVDNYGGSIENRCRFALELLDAVLQSIGPTKVMVRISPSRFMGGLYEWPNLNEMLDYLVINFKMLGLLQLDVSCANADYFATSGKIIRYIRSQWPHLIIGGASLSVDDAQKELDSGLLDLVTWGRGIIANPDFVNIIKKNGVMKEFNDSMRADLI